MSTDSVLCVNVSTGELTPVAGIKGTKTADDLSNLGDGKKATEATLRFPRGIASDSKGNIYIADTGNNRIRVIDKDGFIKTLRIVPGVRAIASDAAGNLFFTRPRCGLVWATVVTMPVCG